MGVQLIKIYHLSTLGKGPFPAPLTVVFGLGWLVGLNFNLKPKKRLKPCSTTYALFCHKPQQLHHSRLIHIL
jgi:hypothetical protein